MDDCCCYVSSSSLFLASPNLHLRRFISRHRATVIFPRRGFFTSSRCLLSRSRKQDFPPRLIWRPVAELTAPQSSTCTHSSPFHAIVLIIKSTDCDLIAQYGGHDSPVSRAFWSLDIISSIRKGDRQRRASRQGRRSLRDRTRCRNRAAKQSGTTESRRS